jgi:hypothetical protein
MPEELPMLAPGDYLIQPPPPVLAPTPPPEGAPAAKPAHTGEDDDEPSMSFLMILLRALGVMHT